MLCGFVVQAELYVTRLQSEDVVGLKPHAWPEDQQWRTQCRKAKLHQRLLPSRLSKHRSGEPRSAQGPIGSSPQNLHLKEQI